MTIDEARKLRPGGIVAVRFPSMTIELPMIVARWDEAKQMVVAHRNVGILANPEDTAEEWIDPVRVRVIA
jgi:hypothetical protein